MAMKWSREFQYEIWAVGLAADAEEKDGARCVEGEAVFWLEHEKALRPGHIYSHDGIAEYNVSKLCEYHFDEWADKEATSERL